MKPKTHNTSEAIALLTFRLGWMQLTKISDLYFNVRKTRHDLQLTAQESRSLALGVITFDRKGDWYSVSSNECSGYMHSSQFKIVYP